MISVIIPVYKNTEQMLTNLRHNMQFFKNCEVILVNDDPTKSIKTELSEFKDIKLYENEKNIGFGQNVNKGVSFSTGQYLLFLNTDVKLNDNSFQNALKHFENDTELFGVSFAQQETNRQIVGKNQIFWHRGMFHHRQAATLLSGENAWAEGGTALINKDKFLILGGFDTLYTPFYWEDIDISYRAWKAGYHILFDASIVMEHHHEGTTGKYFLKEITKRVSYRNQLFFIWKNITDFSLISQHIILLAPNIFYYTILKNEHIFFLGLIDALKQLNTVFKHRKKQLKIYQLSDKEVLEKFRQ